MWEKTLPILHSYDVTPDRTPGEKGQEPAFAGLMAEFVPKMEERAGESGLMHPGIALTAEILDNVRMQVRRGEEPWKTYFEDMLLSRAASKEPPVCLTDPAGTCFASQDTNRMFRQDGLTVYTQAVLYYVTGDSIYRRNALHILRLWSGLDPDTYSYFTDACIHVGVPMNRMCMGAEIIRYSSYRTQGGYGDLEWSDGEISDFQEHLVKPAVKTFLSSRDEFMNQHLYTVMGAMSAYLFLDDVNGYEKTVEWFTVNRRAKNQGFNGSVKRLFREIKTVDEVGTREGSGKPLPVPVIQHMEMGRDQAHGCGDLTNAAIIARMLLGQKTKVDPKDGTVSGAQNAVGVYEFLDDRILKAADFFSRYMLGYETDWVQAPFSIREGKIADNYRAISPNYRGRYDTMNFWDLYAYYTDRRPDVSLEEEYPYFYEAFRKKVPSNYYTEGKQKINWDNGDGGGDFWLFLPPGLAGDEKLLARPQRDYRVEVADRGVMVGNREAMCVKEEQGIRFIRFLQSAEKSRLAVTSGGTGNPVIAFHIRTDGIAKLTLENGVGGSIFLPDTGGQWEYVTFRRKAWESFGNLYYLVLSELSGSCVDIDAIDIKPDVGNESRDPIVVLEFEDGSRERSYTAFCKGLLDISFVAETQQADRGVSYSGAELPKGAALDQKSGRLTWRPHRAGRYVFWVHARAGGTCLVKKAEVIVARNRAEAVTWIWDQVKGQDYTAATWGPCQRILGETRQMAARASDEAFGAQLRKLEEAAGHLKLLAPRLEADPLTDGTSLDYPHMVEESTMGEEIFHLTDGSGSFCGYYKAREGVHIMDFGSERQVFAVKFGYQARYGFPDRLAGAQVFGSNDRESWNRLTAAEAACTQNYQETAVREEEKGNGYRYLKVCKTTEYPDVLRGDISGLLELGEFRIFGDCREICKKGDVTR